MAAKIPTESLWKSVMQKNQVKGADLQKALATYEKLGDDKSEARIKALDTIKKVAGALAKDKETAAKSDVAKFLGTVAAAVEPAKKEIAAAAKKADEGATGKKVDLSKMKTLATAAKKLAADAKRLQDQTKNDPQVKAGNTCGAEGQRAARALANYIAMMIALEGAIAACSVGGALAVAAVGAAAYQATDAVIEWGHAADEYLTCLRHAGQRERAREFEEQAQRARTLGAAMRREGDALKRAAK